MKIWKTLKSKILLRKIHGYKTEMERTRNKFVVFKVAAGPWKKTIKSVYSLYLNLLKKTRILNPTSIKIYFYGPWNCCFYKFFISSGFYETDPFIKQN